MAEAKLSVRAQKILNSFSLPISPSPQFIRQQTLADELGCSRRTIGRALKELKEAGLLVDLNQRHENRCKLYEISPYAKALGDNPLTPQAQLQWEKFEKTFRIVFKMPELPKYYAQVTWELADVRQESELWTKTFAGLWAIGL